ncbi:MAG: hypothetical protein M1815_000669 [Lichina confinis]|nr:MAG: hypothetical protein M1815_000669 [Lichina confinis]
MGPFSHLPSYNPLSLLRTSGLVTGHGFSLSETPPLSGKVAVITGGQAGIGKEIVAQLLLHGISKAYVIARSQEKYVAAKKAWAQRDGITEQDADSRTVFIKCNLTDLQEVKAVAEGLVEEADRLDILFNHAGMPPVAEYSLSVQGIETIFATNHVGHFALTGILLPLLEKTANVHGDARIVVTTSSFHLACQEIDFASVTSTTRTKSPAAVDSCYRYARSKLANVLFTKELTRILDRRGIDGVYVNYFFPGNIPTDAMDVWKQLLGSLAGSLMKGVFQLVGQSEQDAAATALFLSASEVVTRDKIRGRYFIPIAIEDKPSAVAGDEDLAKNLWAWTEQKVAETLGQGWAVYEDS